MWCDDHNHDSMQHNNPQLQQHMMQQPTTTTAHSTTTIMMMLMLQAGPVAAFLHALGLQRLQRGAPECLLPTVKQGWGGGEWGDNTEAKLCEFRSRAQLRWPKCLI